MDINEIMQYRLYMERSNTLSDGEIVEIEFYNPITKLTVLYYPRVEMYKFVYATKICGFRFESGKLGNIENDDFFHTVEKMYYKYVEMLRKIDNEWDFFKTINNQFAVYQKVLDKIKE